MLTKGDRVVMNNKYHVPERYRGKEFIVTAGRENQKLSRSQVSIRVCLELIM